MAAPIQLGKQMITFADPQDEERKRRMALGKAQGLDDTTIARYELIKQVQQKQQAQQQLAQQAQQAQPQQPQSKKASGWKRLLIQGGALGAQALAGAGSIAAAPFTGGVSLVAGAGAGYGINALKDKLLGEKQSIKGNLLESALTVLPGVGKLAKEGLTGLKGARAGEEALVAAKAAKSAAPEKDALKTILSKTFKTPEEGGRLTKVSNALKKTSTGVTNVSEGFKAGENATKRLATVQQYGIGGGRRGLQKGAEVLSGLENELQPILQKTKIPVKNVSGVLDNVAKYSEAEVTNPLMKRVLASQNKALQNAAKDGVISGDELRAIRSKLGSGIFQGAETGSKDLKKEIYRAYGDLIGEKAPKARSILTQQHDVLGLEKGLTKRAEGARVPILGGALTKSPAAGQVRDLGLDFAANVTGKVGKVTGNPIVKTGVQQGLARSFLKPGFETPQDQTVAGQTQLPQDTSQVFANPQSLDEANLNQLVSSGVTDPQKLFDSLNSPPDSYPGQTGSALEGQLGGFQSKYGIDQYQQDIQTDLATTGGKNIDKITKIFTTVQAAEQQAQKAQQAQLKALKGGGATGNVGKLSAQSYTLAQQGTDALSKLADLVEKDPEVIGRSATPGRGLPIVGGLVGAASKTTGFDTLGFKAVSSLLRAQSGAAVPDSEVRSYMRAYLPRAGDSKKEVDRKFRELMQSFQTVLDIGSQDTSSDFSADDLVQQLTAQRGY